MDNDDWDLFSIVRRCKATTLAQPTTNFETPPPTTTIPYNNTISPQNTTSSYFDSFTFNDENNSFPFTPPRPNDFIDLEKLIFNSIPTTVVPTPTTTIPTPTTLTTITPTIPTHITTTATLTNTSVQGSDQNSIRFDFPIPVEHQLVQPNYLTELEKIMLNFNPITINPTPTFTTPTTPTTITPVSNTTTFTTPKPTTIIHTPFTTTPTMSTVLGTNQNTTFSDFSMFIQQQHIQPDHNNQVFALKTIACVDITTAHFDRANNHPSVLNQPSREQNQPPIPVPRTTSRVLPYTHPHKPNSRKRRSNDMVMEFCMNEDKLEEDPWAWRKYGQKPIKGSEHPRHVIFAIARNCGKMELMWS
ncbi:WRKY DNA-binding domain protein [Medicago truncatula]|uniref:WRKY DNA-binding domain protein n=1 Tax=Medicago truncatula TaxID=3880 RepID=G7KQX9_MEDTR|nr:WRKY DNA-binding domain protein [Medicago truncatula]